MRHVRCVPQRQLLADESAGRAESSALRHSVSCSDALDGTLLGAGERVALWACRCGVRSLQLVSRTSPDSATRQPFVFA